MSRITETTGNTVFVERRVNGERRQGDRRKSEERRHDSRDGSNGQKKSIRIWLRSLTNARLGVDRRKEDRRSSVDRRQQNIRSLLTKEELNDLLMD